MLPWDFGEKNMKLDLFWKNFVTFHQQLPLMLLRQLLHIF